jgi:hypothetical protein
LSELSDALRRHWDEIAIVGIGNAIKLLSSVRFDASAEGEVGFARDGAGLGARELDEPLSHRREEESAGDDAISVEFDRDV